MTILATSYMGLSLPSPIIAAASGMTQTVESVERCVDAGAGAVVLKSIFEEQITQRVEQEMGDTQGQLGHPEAEAYMSTYGREQAVEETLSLVRDASRAVDVPVVASVNCVSPGSWVDFARRAEEAGAAGIELNVFIPSSAAARTPRDIEAAYFRLAADVKAKVSVPVAMKVGPYFSSQATMLRELGAHVDALVLFNRFVQIDIDLDEIALCAGPFLSHADEALLALRAISITSGRTPADLAATSGVHDGHGVAKQLLAGAAAVQVASALYQHGIPHLRVMLEDLRAWMDEKGFAQLSDFRGRLSQSQSENPADYERLQFMQASIDARDGGAPNR
jgi:dihydroorotate dehydrogenase (fumarate)